MMAKALSIKQAWAWLICMGLKDVENRTWRTRERGQIFIHAGKAFDREFDWDWAKAILKQTAPDIRLPGPGNTAYQFGGIVGCALLVDCVDASPSPWFTGPHGLVLQRAGFVGFKACRGQLGFFDPFRSEAPAEGGQS